MMVVEVGMLDRYATCRGVATLELKEMIREEMMTFQSIHLMLLILKLII